ncbi:MAG: pyridoxal-phosphate dependent enzyme, partial [Thermomicrobiales bacterium]|nr:pyridoxal-phosphate dependent enzyme [Thermomicrobiales bacterium]
MTSSDGVVAGSGVDHIPIGLQEIEAAYRLLTGKAEFLPGRTTQFALRTPLVLSEPLTQQLGCRVWLKLENLQRTGSYKVRGAFNNVAQLPPEQRAKGLVTASAGNHAQGVAAAAAVFDIAAQTSVFVPVGTPKVKQENTRAFGVDVREVGDTFDQARQAAYQEAERSGRAFIEPFDAWNTIAGQGTVGLEIAADLPTCRGIVAPIGGGGLISGIALAARELLPGTEVIGAQATGAAAMIASLESGAPTDLAFPPTTQIADGIKVSRPGDRPFGVVQALIGADRIVAVPDFEPVAAAADLMVYAKVIAEGAGAISLAALREIQMGRFA